MIITLNQRIVGNGCNFIAERNIELPIHTGEDEEAIRKYFASWLLAPYS